MSDMSILESAERFREGLLKAIARCRELAKASENRTFNQIAFQLEGILKKGLDVYQAKPTPEDEVERLLKQFQSELKT